MTSIKTRIGSGPSPLSGVLQVVPSPVATQAIAAGGADWVLIDQEHGPIGPESLHAMIASTAGTDCSPWVRVPGADPAAVKTALDSGAEGIVFPQVTDAVMAAECVAMTRYPPRGVRGWGPFVAASRWGVSLFDYLECRGDATVCVLLIETPAAIENIEAICRVEGIDCLIIAPYDLSTALGVPGQLDSPALVEAVHRAERAILAAGIPLGGVALDAARTASLLDRGYRILLQQIDVLMLQQATREAVGWRNG
jgi:4-hydroxy-2-oxoheptanedioate aldolase